MNRDKINKLKSTVAWSTTDQRTLYILIEAAYKTNINFKDPDNYTLGELLVDRFVDVVALFIMVKNRIELALGFISQFVDYRKNIDKKYSLSDQINRRYNMSAATNKPLQTTNDLPPKASTSSTPSADQYTRFKPPANLGKATEEKAFAFGTNKSTIEQQPLKEGLAAPETLVPTMYEFGPTLWLLKNAFTGTQKNGKKFQNSSQGVTNLFPKLFIPDDQHVPSVTSVYSVFPRMTWYDLGIENIFPISTDLMDIANFLGSKSTFKPEDIIEAMKLIKKYLESANLIRKKKESPDMALPALPK